MGKRINQVIGITIPPNVRTALKARSIRKGVSVSGILSILAKIYCQIPLSGAVEKDIENDIKREMGRQMFIAYLQAVGEAMPPNANPIITGEKGVEYEPESWTVGKTGYLAFYNPVAENEGLVFIKSTSLKNKQKLSKVYVIVPHPPIMDENFKRDLRTLNIEVIPLADIKSTFNKNNRKRD